MNRKCHSILSKPSRYSEVELNASYTFNERQYSNNLKTIKARCVNNIIYIIVRKRQPESKNSSATRDELLVFKPLENLQYVCTM